MVPAPNRRWEGMMHYRVGGPSGEGDCLGYG